MGHTVGEGRRTRNVGPWMRDHERRRRRDAALRQKHDGWEEDVLRP